ncbi:superfamily I DNA/RNA helicase [Rhizobium rosettiformans]|uniref:DNA 3'-5' helicase n=2 Tax=Rhizobium rosettiformans TaxID=1368430 RepID=A0A4S8PH71_9HYPH|nr:ATP-dependent helicase [Rhizobium rosettiformans]MBB5278678.1 superfamily I DNA/RNA helicase [Rhizobium rosettiformans]THV29947.1 ATP-dependent helicase [Rhizobium rosettiformans W3]
MNAPLKNTTAKIAYSIQQSAVIDWTIRGWGSALVRARAGTGKTFLLLACLPHMRGHIGVAAFNNKIAKEIAHKVGERGLSADVKTFHAYGFGAWRKVAPSVKIEGKGARNAGYFKIDRIFQEVDVPEELRIFVRRAMSYAKQKGVGIFTAIDDQQAWNTIVNHFDLGDLFEGEDDSGYDDFIKDGISFAIACLKASNNLSREVIDFDDMLYVPLLNNVRFWQYDWLLVDEAQDTNPVRREMARRLLKRGGRAIFVGDDRQAIYGFTGADNDSLDIIKETFKTEEFPLTVTYRCPKSVVAEAKRLVPDYEAAELNGQGTVERITEADFDFSVLQPNDAIICRNTRPLVTTAFQLIRAGIACHVEGREIGAGLLALATRWKSVKGLGKLKERLELYFDKEVEKLQKQDRESAIGPLEDKVETLKSLIGYVGIDKTVADLREHIESLFADTPEGCQPNRVILLTAHRSKGLEYDNVYLWGANKFMPSNYARKQWQLQQEENLEYVAITRAMSKLVYVEVV